MRNPRMLPCPHCASDNVTLVVVVEQPMTWAVRCDECFATGPYSVTNGPVFAVFAWNRRAGRLDVVK